MQIYIMESLGWKTNSKNENFVKALDVHSLIFLYKTKWSDTWVRIIKQKIVRISRFESSAYRLFGASFAEIWIAYLHNFTVFINWMQNLAHLLCIFSFSSNFEIWHWFILLFLPFSYNRKYKNGKDSLVLRMTCVKCWHEANLWIR